METRKQNPYRTFIIVSSVLCALALVVIVLTAIFAVVLTASPRTLLALLVFRELAACVMVFAVIGIVVALIMTAGLENN